MGRILTMSDDDTPSRSDEDGSWVHEEGRQTGLSQAAAHLRGEALRHRTRDASHMTTAQRERMINYLLRLARTVESLK